MRKKVVFSILLSLVVLLLGLTPVVAQEACPPDECCHYDCSFSHHLQEVDALEQLLNALDMTTIDELEAYLEIVGYIDVTELLGFAILPPMGSSPSVSPEMTPFCTPIIIYCSPFCTSRDFLDVRFQWAINRDGATIPAWIIWCSRCFTGRSATDINWRCICSNIDWRRTHFFA